MVNSESKQEILRVADIVAYLGDSVGLEAVVHLSDSDNVRFGYLVTRTLDYAWGRGNPYTLAYRIVAKCQYSTLSEVARWVSGTAGQRGAYRAWATAMVGQNLGRNAEEALH